MSKVVDLEGRKFSRLFVVRRAGSNATGQAQWECLCDCGASLTVLGNHLSRGNTRSCGCLKNDELRERRKTHGQSGTLTYRVWNTMLDRCMNPNSKKYESYGGRGIVVCQRWMRFENFLADMGEKDRGESIERIDNSGNYELENCKWGTAKEQANNTRRNRLLTYQGRTMTLTEWAKILCIYPGTLHERLTKYSVEDALSHGKER